MNDKLYHYNHNHDPKTGRFARSLRTSSNLAMDVNELAVKKEPKISNDVKEAVEKSGGKLYGFDNRIKQVESIERKINTHSKEKNISLFEASKIKDAVRYTSISMDNDFVKSYNSVKKLLESKGYKEIRCKNYFELYKQGIVKHKSVQSVFADSDGYQFEIQFQTPSSQDAKNRKLPIYEERRKPGLSNKRKKELEEAMVELSEKVPYPRDIDKIKSHT